MKISCSTKDTLSLNSLVEFQGELKKRTSKDINKIITSIKKFGFATPFFVWQHEGTNFVLDGHGRLSALHQMEKNGEAIPPLPVVYVNCQDESTAKQLLLRITSQYGEMTAESVLEFMGDLDLQVDELSLPSGTLDFNFDEQEEKYSGSLAEEFLIPPFSVIDSKNGKWQERKRAWKSIGLKSEEGRDNNMMKALSALSAKSSQGDTMSDGSIFDPVLCEILYTWFGREGCNVLDPFTGGSVRGVIAGIKKMNYIGFDIRQEQIDANEKQRFIVDDNDGIQPTWICSDSNKMNDFLPGDYKADLVFSCPPYADLEVYSDLKDDISNMEYKDFLKVYREIIKKACDRLADNRFAVFVIGECRGKDGNYYNFVGDTISAFIDAGLHYYNEIALLNSIGSKALTASIGMKKTRKVGKIHQNVLVFLKGNAKKAVEFLGDTRVLELSEEDLSDKSGEVD